MERVHCEFDAYSSERWLWLVTTGVDGCVCSRSTDNHHRSFSRDDVTVTSRSSDDVIIGHAHVT